MTGRQWVAEKKPKNSASASQSDQERNTKTNHSLVFRVVIINYTTSVMNRGNHDVGGVVLYLKLST